MKRLLLLVRIFMLVVVAHTQAVAQLTGLTISGDPENLTNGATWTYQATTDGVDYDLRGILFKPPGEGPFSAIIINHGTGGSANGYSKKIAREMVTWGYVCIATNYTHSSGVPCGAPGACTCTNCPGTNPCTCPDWGASANNVLRGKKCWDIVTSLSYVEESCVMAFGHSRGAWLTTALVATYPDKFKAVGHTAGGVTTASGTNAPTATLASQITAPYIAHHSKDDIAVVLAMDSLLYNVLENNNVPHELHVYETFEDNSYCFNPNDVHCLVSEDALMYERTKAWFNYYSCPGPVLSVNSDGAKGKPIENSELIQVFPNPSHEEFTIATVGLSGDATIRFFNSLGDILFIKEMTGSSIKITTEGIPAGVYVVHLTFSDRVFVEEISIR